MTVLGWSFLYGLECLKHSTSRREGEGETRQWRVEGDVPMTVNRQ